jgi:hypothetical protein
MPPTVRTVSAAKFTISRDCDNELLYSLTGAPGKTPFSGKRRAALDLHAKLVVLDVNVDLFGGEENIRARAHSPTF